MELNSRHWIKQLVTHLDVAGTPGRVWHEGLSPDHKQHTVDGYCLAVDNYTGNFSLKLVINGRNSTEYLTEVNVSQSGISRTFVWNIYILIYQVSEARTYVNYCTLAIIHMTSTTATSCTDVREPLANWWTKSEATRWRWTNQNGGNLIKASELYISSFAGRVAGISCIM